VLGEKKLTKEVIIEEYNSEWIKQFEYENTKIRLALCDEKIVIEHIGSTSIIGLPSKPIMDIAIGVNELGEADAFIESLGAIGYEYVPKQEFPNRRFFRKGEWRKGTHHLHVYIINSEEWNNNLLFRNYLRNHPEKVKEYANLRTYMLMIEPLILS
jgi:GrpB-like predicted nucleotidyltransferase (UPF0157 family)